MAPWRDDGADNLVAKSMMFPDDGFRTVMRRVTVGLFIAFVLAGASAIAASPTGLAPAFPVRASAPTVLPTFSPSPAVAGHGDLVRFVFELNATGNGQFQWIGVEIAFEPPLGLAIDAASATYPANCLRVQTLAWRCSNVRAGLYEWTIPTRVLNNSRVQHAQNATATLSSSLGRLWSPVPARLWVGGAVLDLRIDAGATLSARPNEPILYSVTVLNALEDPANATNTAYGVTIEIRLDPGLELGPHSEGLSTEPTDLTPKSAAGLTIETIVRGNVTPGTVVGIEATVRYVEFNNHPVNLTMNSAPLYIRSPDVVPSVVGAAAIGLAAIIVALVVLLYMGQRRLVIDEAFLMHQNGVLIHHASRGPSAKKDDDLVASMLVVIQEFVRDSFKSEALLDGVSFGGRRVALVRGRHVILAAVISRGDVEHLVPQMLEVVNAVETAYGRILAAWDGRMTRLVGVQGIMNRFMRGGYRAAWRARIT